MGCNRSNMQSTAALPPAVVLKPPLAARQVLLVGQVVFGGVLQLGVCSKVGDLGVCKNAEAAVASDSAAQRLLSAQQKRCWKCASWLRLCMCEVCRYGLSKGGIGFLKSPEWLFPFVGQASYFERAGCVCGCVCGLIRLFVGHHTTNPAKEAHLICAVLWVSRSGQEVQAKLLHSAKPAATLVNSACQLRTAGDTAIVYKHTSR